MMNQKVNKRDLFESLPPVWKGKVPASALEQRVRSGHKLVVLDDDPTGTQTVHDVPVLTEWSVERLRDEFANDLPCFYVLTNSRSLPTEDARALMEELSGNLLQACGDRTRFTMVSRSDSTLRGHYPAETDVLEHRLGPFKATLLIPYFEAGGRYTIHDTHYVQDGDELIQAADTPFAQDAVFGYRHSRMQDWVEEKTGGDIKAEDVSSLTLDCIRQKGVEGVKKFLESLSQGSVCVVNAAAPEDLDVVTAACAELLVSNHRFLFRTGAQFVSAWLGMKPRIISYAELGAVKESTGGLIVIGSHVPLSSHQLAALRGAPHLVEIECPVSLLLQSDQRTPFLNQLRIDVQSALAAGRNVVLFTSRTLVTGDTAHENLNISRLVSDALVNIVEGLEIRPRYLIAKGGITSSDIATRALGLKRGMVVGQAAAGIPVWLLGAESKFPDMHYIVFPGNVGDTQTLLKIFQKLNPS